MRIWRLDFKSHNSNDVWYDLLDDYALIEASFLQQYGIRLSENEMTWREFSDLLSCINEDTSLGRIVAIRRENDTEVLSHFTPAQLAERDRWREEHCKALTKQEYEANMQSLLEMALA